MASARKHEPPQKQLTKLKKKTMGYIVGALSFLGGILRHFSKPFQRCCRLSAWPLTLTQLTPASTMEMKMVSLDTRCCRSTLDRTNGTYSRRQSLGRLTWFEDLMSELMCDLSEFHNLHWVSLSSTTEPTEQLGPSSC